jgi:acetoin:2,6-dichlorophenolindophenol oxidoreductase subunit alpha
MHLCAPHQGLMVTSAIVSSAIPVAVGAAYANKVKGNGAIVVVFFGDGATEEGVFWESINVASLMKLPVLFVCEDNELAVYTHPKDRRGYDSIDDIISQYNCGVDKLESTDVEEIYKFSSKAIESVRAGKGPYFLHFKYYRYLEHVGINEDFDAGYRKKEEFHKWFEKDPINIQRAKLIGMGVSEDALSDIEEKINGRIDNSIKLARKSPMTDTNELLMDIVK